MSNLSSLPSTHRAIGNETAALDALAARLEGALVPVTPSAEFRARLQYGLQMAAYHREVHQLLVRPRAETPWRWLVGAAALGSAAGLLTILLRWRPGRLSEPIAVASNK